MQMWLRIFGACGVVAACSGFGFQAGVDYRRRMAFFQDFIDALDEMTRQLNQSLLPLPELVLRASNLGGGALFDTMSHFSRALTEQLATDTAACMYLALEAGEIEDAPARRLMMQLGRSLGRFDLQGQLKGLEVLRGQAERALQHMQQEKTGLLRSYRTLGVFGGMALAVLLL